VVPPLAVKPTVLPEHIVGVGGTTLIVGNGFTVIVTVAVLLHGPVVPVTVYVVVEPGVAVTLAPVVALKPAAGLHV